MLSLVPFSRARRKLLLQFQPSTQLYILARHIIPRDFWEANFLKDERLFPFLKILCELSYFFYISIQIKLTVNLESREEQVSPMILRLYYSRNKKFCNNTIRNAHINASPKQVFWLNNFFWEGEIEISHEMSCFVACHLWLLNHLFLILLRRGSIPKLVRVFQNNSDCPGKWTLES